MSRLRQGTLAFLRVGIFRIVTLLVHLQFLPLNTFVVTPTCQAGSISSNSSLPHRDDSVPPSPSLSGC